MLDEVMLNKFRNLYNDVLEDIKNYSFNSSIKQIELNSKLKNDINNIKRKYIVLDRIEEDVAVCEVIGENKMIGIKKSKLPLNVKEGNVLKFDRGRYIIDFDKTKELEENIEVKIKNLWDN